MQFLTGTQGTDVHEHLLNSDGQRIGHRIIAKGQITGNDKLHPAPAHGVVIPVKGRIEFKTDGYSEEIYPGKVVVMEKGELHCMRGIEDSEIIVVLDLLR
ncbi:hypothetical protein AYR54_08355 [Loigolactobacillus backii]|uniref:hypothetical protein n=1 Tax=Loigolactobacillus backii TaxID=375175 RepID=UPI0007F063CE|nr:hypothetical protein [Loigolactobacillus backii]ANK60366.1 hypothetical protein AYR52_08950 [Loigolactobacillus backii]ANK65245.1 hypothetical protein AYR54_08355 [Loigolactobacillus backii]ANK67804.1 hypothetical protein AYR55_08960 [Loigolactobacillus backii]OLF70264.1 hypothetical protein ACX53_03345 [Loigolactobacillus backii]PIO86969.1 hypothetical protein B8A32_07365 [Loigolactobacillus backii]